MSIPNVNAMQQRLIEIIEERYDDTSPFYRGVDTGKKAMALELLIDFFDFTEKDFEQLTENRR